MDDAEWTNSVLVRPDDLVDTVTKLREEPGGDVLVNGSAQLVEALRANDLVDEYRLMVFPVVLGSGNKMFPDSPRTWPLKLISSLAFSTGVVVNEFEPVRN